MKNENKKCRVNLTSDKGEDSPHLVLYYRNGLGVAAHLHDGSTQLPRVEVATTDRKAIHKMAGQPYAKPWRKELQALTGLQVVATA